MEVATTERVLAAVPEKNIDWRPDPKSRSAVELTAHVAGHAAIFDSLIQTGEIRATPMPTPKSIKEAAGIWTAFIPKVDKALKSMDEKTWEQKTATLYGPKGEVWQSSPMGGMMWFALVDLIHHRGQLCTYIRPLGGKVPSIYGPSADSSGAGM
jgi:uncharacterized damage-inducible protein DinB